MFANCKWCGDRPGGCLYCADEIEKQEKERTEQIKNWQPPDPTLIEALRNRSFPEGDYDMQERFAIAMLLQKINGIPGLDNGLTDEQLENFITTLTTPPPVFQAHQGDDDAMEVLKKHFHRERFLGDLETGVTPLERGEAARIELKLRRQFKTRYNGY